MVSLINISTIGTYLIKGEDSIALRFLKEVIGEAELYPKVAYNRLEPDKFYNELEEIKGSDYIGISCTTFTYQLAMDVCRRLKRFNIPIILGGSHVPDKEMAESVLKTGLVDYVIVGEAGSFKELVKGNTDAQGIYRLENGNITGSGISKYPDNPPPMIVSRKGEFGYETEVLLNNACPNKCGYCNSNKTLINVPVEQYINRLKKDCPEKISRVFFYDNNPLAKFNIRRTKEFFDAFESEFGYIPSTILYCDPSNEFDPEFLARFKSRNNNIFFGKEVADESIGRRIGRNYCGKLRSQERLDNEVKNLLSLAKQVKTEPDGQGLEFNIVNNYIITPFETKETVKKLLEEVMLFKRFRRFIIRSNFLWPFPATFIRREYKGQFVTPETVKLNYLSPDDLNFWNSGFMDLLMCMNARIYVNHMDPMTEYNLAAFRLAANKAFGTELKYSLTGKMKDRFKEIETAVSRCDFSVDSLLEIYNAANRFVNIDSEELVSEMKQFLMLKQSQGLIHMQAR